MNKEKKHISLFYRVARENLHTFKNCCHFSCFNTTEKCNMALERKFCEFFGDIFKNCGKCFYEELFVFLWQVAESAYADWKSKLKI